MTPSKNTATYHECLECGLVIRQGIAGRCPSDQTELIPVYTFEDPLEGTILNQKYRVVKCCGSGASGVVYRAQHLALNKDVAIKFLHKHLLDDPEKLERFENEARTLSNLSHPNIVKVIDFGLTPQPYIVMDFVHGQRLDQVLKTVGRFPTKIAIKVFQQICAGMSVVHNEGLVHQDLKPANILVSKLETSDPSVLILDFGTARLLDSDTQKTGVIVGSPPYMSPEQCEGRPTDQRSDVYSMGCLMYEVLSGRKVFSAFSTEEYIFKHLNQLPQSLAVTNPELKIPEELDRLIGRALSKQLDFRVQSMSDLSAGMSAARNNSSEERQAKPPVVALPRILPGLIGVQIAAILCIMLLNVDSSDGVFMALSIACRNTFILLAVVTYPYWLICVYKVLKLAKPAASKWGTLLSLILVGAPFPLLGVAGLSYAHDEIGEVLTWFGLAVWLTGVCFFALRVYAPVLNQRPYIGLLLIVTVLISMVPLTAACLFAPLAWAFLLLYLIRAGAFVTDQAASTRQTVTLVVSATLVLTLLETVWAVDPVRSSERQMNRLVSHFSKEPYWYSQRARYYFDEGKYDLAMMDAEKAVSIYPSYTTAWRTRAKAAAKVYDYVSLINSNKHLLSINPANFAVQYECGQCYALLGQTTKALEEFRAALVLAKVPGEKAEAHQACASQLLRLGDVDGAMREVEQAIAADKSLANAWLLKARIYQQENKVDLVLRTCDNMSQFKEFANPVGCLRADAISQQGKSADALKLLDQLDPTAIDTLLTRAMVLSRSRQFSVAIDTVLLALENASVTSENVPGDCYFTLARVTHAAGELKKALTYAQDAVALSPEMKERIQLVNEIQAHRPR